MQNLLSQLSDEQFMALLSLVEKHKVSDAIDYLCQNTALSKEQAMALAAYSIEQHQRALFSLKQRPTYVPKLRLSQDVHLEEEYQFDDQFLANLNLQIADFSPRELQHNLKFLSRHQQDPNSTLKRLWLVALILVIIFLLSLFGSIH